MEKKTYKFEAPMLGVGDVTITDPKIEVTSIQFDPREVDDMTVNITVNLISDNNSKIRSVNLGSVPVTSYNYNEQGLIQAVQFKLSQFEIK